MKRLISFLLLPTEVTDFERSYLARVNRVALALFATHVPAFAIIAWLNHTGAALAALLTSAVLVGPAVAVHKLDNPRLVSIVLGIAAMFFGALLVHFGQGPVQIEMHFYFFSLLAMCAVFGNPMVIVAAAVTVALHHLIVWLVLPRSVFNYQAAWWVVAVHAAFVVLESVATCYIARSFFDNVIGLERIVQARTAALDAKNRDMRLLLDNVEQGFLTIDKAGVLAQERSAAVDRWLGAPGDGDGWFDWVGKTAPRFASASRAGWSEVVEGVMPLELTLDQMPHVLQVGNTQLNIEYRPIGASEPHDRYLVIATDVTAEVARELAELSRREAMAVFERILSDRTGAQSFFEEGSHVIDVLTHGSCTDLTVIRRMLHTLKGNAGLFGLDSIATLCHALEDSIADSGSVPAKAAFDGLVERWARLTADVERIVGHRARGFEIDEADFTALATAVARKEPHGVLVERVRNLRYEPVARRFSHFAEQAKRIAERLDKGNLQVVVEDNGVRLDAQKWASFWSAFVHAVRNAVDHGIESPSGRITAAKPPEGRLVLRARQDLERTVIEVVDDGRGIDWAAVRQHAVHAGLPATTREDLERALFAEGLSTADSVTDVSGRGIGMGALAQGVHDLGGRLSVESTTGAGTTVRVTIPRRRSRESFNPAA